MTRKMKTVIFLGLFIKIFVLAVGIICSVSMCRIQITPEHYPYTKWVSLTPDLYFTVYENKLSEGVMNIDGEKVRIYAAWIPGSQRVNILDADLEDSGEYPNGRTLLISGYGHWRFGKYIVAVDTDNVEIDTDEIVFSERR